MEQRYDKETGLPVDRAYLECGLPLICRGLWIR